MSISERLKAVRVDHDLTQKQLSDRLNIGQATIACYENGSRDPHIFSLIAYADFFECSLDYLVGRSDEIGKVFIGESGNKVYVSDDERQLLETYRKLNKSDRTKLTGYIDCLTDK